MKPEARERSLEDRLRRQARAVPPPSGDRLRARVMTEIEGERVGRATAWRALVPACAALLVAVLAVWSRLGERTEAAPAVSWPDLALWDGAAGLKPAALLDEPLAREASALTQDLAAGSRHLLACAGWVE